MRGRQGSITCSLTWRSSTQPNRNAVEPDQSGPTLLLLATFLSVPTLHFRLRPEPPILILLPLSELAFLLTRGSPLPDNAADHKCPPNADAGLEGGA